MQKSEVNAPIDIEFLSRDRPESLKGDSVEGIRRIEIPQDYRAVVWPGMFFHES